MKVYHKVNRNKLSVFTSPNIYFENIRIYNFTTESTLSGFANLVQIRITISIIIVFSTLLIIYGNVSSLRVGTEKHSMVHTKDIVALYTHIV